MGFKENINRDLWGNPEDSVYLDKEIYNLYSPYKDTWLGGNQTLKHMSADMNFRNLMYTGDLPPAIDETICPWGINANSGIGNTYLMGGYKTGGYVYTIDPVKATTNTAKRQKPAFFVWSPFETGQNNPAVRPLIETTGYLENAKTEGFTTDFPNAKWQYCFINNLKYSNITVLPVIIVTDQFATGKWNDIRQSFPGICYINPKSTSFYDEYSYQKQFTVWEYFNGSDEEGVPYTEKYSQILGVYACIFYQSDYQVNTGQYRKIPNLSINTLTNISDGAIDAFPEWNEVPITQLPYTDSVVNSSTRDRYDYPHYLTVIGHSSTSNSAFSQSGRAYTYTNPVDIDKYTTAEQAKNGAFDYNNPYNSYIIPEDVKDKVITANAKSDSGVTNTAIAWFEGITEEECYKHIAYLGMPFYALEKTMSEAVDDIINSDNTTPEFRHSLMYPDFSANMVTTGTYAPYTSSESPLKDTQWLFDIEENYNPEITFPWAVSFTAIGENDDGSQSGLENAVFTLQYNGNSRFNGVEGSPELIINLSEKTVKWTSTGTDTSILGLPQGEYTLTETVTPEGYTQAQNITFSVTADGKVVNAVNAFGEVIDNNIKIYNKKARRKTVFQYEYITIYDSKTKQNQFNTHGLGVLTPTSCTITENYNGKWELSITHPFGNDNKYQYIREHNIIKALGQLFTIKVVTYSSGDKNEVTAKAEHIFYQQNDWWISPNRSKIIFIPDYSVQSLLDYIDAISEKLIVEGQTYYNFNWYSDMVIPENYPLRIFSNSEGISPVGAIMDSGGVLEVTKGELYRDNFYFSVKERMENSSDNAFEIRIGTNLKGIKRTVDFTTVCTYFSGFDGYGASLDVSWDDNSVNLVGMPHSVKRSKKFSYTFDDQSMTDNEKIEKSFKLLCVDVMTFFGANCKPLISYEVDIEDVQGNPDFAEFNNKPDYRVGNIGTVYDERLGEKVRLKITKTIKDAITGKTKAVIFGDNRSFTSNNGYNSAVMDMTPTVQKSSFQLLDLSAALVFDSDYNAIIQEVKNG